MCPLHTSYFPDPLLHFCTPRLAAHFSYSDIATDIDVCLCDEPTWGHSGKFLGVVQSGHTVVLSLVFPEMAVLISIVTGPVCTPISGGTG